AAITAIVAQGDKENIIVAFYDLHIGRRKRLFEIRNSITSIVSIAFSHDAKYFATLECLNREYTLSLWLWQKSKLIASIKLGAAEGITLLAQILFHPSDNDVISIIGRKYCRLIRQIDGSLRIQPSSSKLENYDFICHAWYDSNRILAGTRNGHVCVLFNGDVQTDIDVVEGRERPVPTQRLSITTPSSLKSNRSQQQQEKIDIRTTFEEVTSLSIITKGFFCIVGGKRLYLYSKISDSWDFAKNREYCIHEEVAIKSTSSTLLSFTEKQHQPTIQKMKKIAISSNEEHILVVTDKQQLYAVTDILIDQIDSKEPTVLQLAFVSYHQSVIRGLDVAVQKPFLVSCGDDHSLRLWNYETNSIEQMRTYNEPIYSVALHPSGH
ncbi:unnamed protein product, partial [Didymodactylos carnosus]